MAALWEEEQKLKEIMERRRMEGSSLQLDAMQRVQELVVSERMLQGQRVKSLKEKKKIPRWSIEKMKEKQMRLWWKMMKKGKLEKFGPERNGLVLEILVKKLEEEVMDKYKVEDGKREAFRCRGAPLEWRRVRKTKR